jgi:hypothetical protein
MEYNYQQLNSITPATGINESIILRLPDNVFVPNDDQNTDWQQYQLWLSQGNTPLPPA